ncbi:helix-turn-helix domain-containing protein [Heyndrickxia sp. NPDC080065]|uniref:helix-turn-helix domain-containing protein n=1 Tax=Heyndrickxia sp. NPDC080065 TaxID=3390568 RepID=UPI003D05A566
MEKNIETKLHGIFDLPDETILHPEEISELINMHVESVRRWCRNGKLPSYSFGGKYIIVGEDFKEFMMKAKVEPHWSRE